jgi:DNA topoisomerase IA
MGGSLIIAEKPSQARNLREALGSRYGRILAARGHIFNRRIQLLARWLQVSVFA